MKIRNGFMLRKVGGQNVVVAVGAASRDFNGIIKLNETGAFLWELLKSEHTAEELTEALLAEYDTDRETAAADVAAFSEKLSRAELLDRG